MLVERKEQKDTLATRILSRARDYGLTNPKGQTFDRVFNRAATDKDIEIEMCNRIFG